MAFGLSAASVGLIGAGVGAASSLLGSKQSGSATSTSQNKLDPRADAMLWGQNGQPGLLSQYQSYLSNPMGRGAQAYSDSQQNYLQGAAADATSQMRQAGSNLLNGSAASVTVPSYAAGNQVQAPSQNSLDLSGAYKGMIYGDPAANPYLTGAIQKGINQSNNAFTNMQTNATTNLMRNIMPSIRSDSVLAGQYGGSRQGIAEGNAIGDFARAQQQAIGQFGQNNTDAAVAAQAGAFDNGQNRALAAMQGLGAQQYATAMQNANTKNQAEFMNVGNQFDASKANAGLNLAGQQAGAGLLSGLNNNAYNVATNQDQYALNNATKVNSLLTPYIGMGQTTTDSRPLYQNQGGSMLGGALAGYGLVNNFTGGGGTTGTLGSLFDGKFMNF
jgi:hypothetical protein